MSVETAPIPAESSRASGVARAGATDPEPRQRFWSGEEYDRLVEQGFFSGERIELVYGEVLQMSPIDEPHAQAIKLADYAVRRAFPPESTTVQVQCPMRLGEHSRPEPDVAVVSGNVREQRSHPTGGLLVIEISDSTLHFDRTRKAALYAEHGIADYWVVNLPDRRVEVFRQPLHDPVSGHRYGEVRVLRPGDSIAPLAAPQAVIAVNDSLP